MILQKKKTAGGITTSSQIAAGPVINGWTDRLLEWKTEVRFFHTHGGD
jgi:hypothetical protein